MRLFRDIAWGLMTTLWVTSLVGVAVLVVALLSRDARADLAEVGGFLRLVCGYAVAAFTTGIVLGVLRPLARTAPGRHVIGGAVTVVAFGTILTVMLGGRLLGSASLLLVFGLGAFVVGALMSPLWYNGVKSGMLWIPDFDSWLRGIVHSTTLRGDDGDHRDGAA